MRVYLAKHGRSLVPADEDAESALHRFGQGEVVRCELGLARNYRFLKKYMALLRIVFDNQDSYSDFYQFRKAIELAAGHCEWIVGLDGAPALSVKSISFDEMKDDIEFERVYGAVMAVCVERFLQGVDMDDLRQEIEAA